MKNLFLFLSILIAVQAASAVEGFNEQPLAAPYDRVWHNTLVLYFKSKNAFGLGTANIMYIKENGGTAFLGLLTAGHVMHDGSQYQKMQIYSNLNIEYKNKRIHLNSQEQMDYKLVSSVESKEHDLAFVVVQVLSAVASHLSPIILSAVDVKPGDPLLLIGFPGVYLRAVADQKIKIQDSSTITKRWSQGIYLGNETQVKGMNGITYGTTIDSMHGDSGGPILSTSGQMVGLLSGQMPGPFIGDDSKDSLQSYSSMVSLQFIREFVIKNWNEFLTN